MKRKNRRSLLLPAAVLAVLLAGCGTPAPSTADTAPQETAAPVPTETPAPTPEPTPEILDDGNLYLAEKTVTDESGTVTGRTAYIYDEAGRCVSETETDTNGDVMTQKGHVYDEKGNCTAEIDSTAIGGGSFSVEETDYTYDAAGRLLTEERLYNGQSNGVTTYLYDEQGVRTGAETEKYTDTYTYDEMGRLIESVHSRKGGDDTSTTTYTYQDGFDLPSSETVMEDDYMRTIVRDFDTRADQGEYIETSRNTIWPDDVTVQYIRLADGFATYTSRKVMNSVDESTYELDEFGSPVRHVYTMGGYQYEDTYKNYYDAKNNLIKVEYQRYNVTSDRSVGAETRTYTYARLGEVLDAAAQE